MIPNRAFRKVSDSKPKPSLNKTWRVCLSAPAHPISTQYSNTAVTGAKALGRGGQDEPRRGSSDLPVDRRPLDDKGQSTLMEAAIWHGLAERNSLSFRS